MMMGKLNKQQQRWLDTVRKKPIMYGLENGFEDLQEIHNEWIKLFLFSKDDLTLQAHRGSYKTTCLSIAIALMIIVFPWTNILFMRKTDDDVKEIVKQIAKLLKTDLFRTLSKVLWSKDVILTIESAFEIDTNLKRNARGTSQLVGIGHKGSITGKHFDIVITDDIVNISDRISRADRERTKITYQELQNVKNRGGRIINTGTPWHKEDAFTLMPNLVKYDCYSTGMMTDKEIQDIRGKMTPSLFAANYELKHIADEDALFTSPNYTDETELILNGIGHIDASYGGDDGTAFTIFKYYKDRIIGFGKRWDKHVDECLSEIQIYHEEYRVGTVYLERNADKGFLTKDLRKLEIPAIDYHEQQNKFIKITTYLRKYWKQIEWIEGTDPDYINEILDYTENAGHDDSPDSAASLIRIIDIEQTSKRKNYSGKGART